MRSLCKSHVSSFGEHEGLEAQAIVTNLARPDESKNINTTFMCRKASSKLIG